ncbi:MAG: hypothetical protein ACKVZ0_19445 [Gemmatimonadales bacterium]
MTRRVRRRALMALLVVVPAAIEKVSGQASRPAPAIRLVRSFDGLGAGFVGPHGSVAQRNPSDNSLAVGPSHVLQTVNSHLAIFTKEGQAIYGPVPTNTVFAGFGGPCQEKNNGDAVVRYDQLARRWLVVMPIFSRNPVRPDEPGPYRAGVAQRSVEGRTGQPGPAVRLPDSVPTVVARPAASRDSGSYAMCYAVSTGTDPRGPYYRYEFVRPLFPDYPRPAVWPDGYYVPTSTGDEVIEKHACVVDRARMLAGAPATEQCVVIPGVNFLNNADLDGTELPPPGAPNPMLAAGGTQLQGEFDDDGLYLWRFQVNWADPSRTRVAGPEKIGVAPYRYLCDGQLSKCVPQPGTDVRLDAQGDKLMARVVYRRRGNVASIVAVHSVAASGGGGGVRWYELRVGAAGGVTLHQQGTHAPDGRYRWMASPAIDRFGNLGIGYSFGGPEDFVGQRFAGRRRGDPRGRLTLGEVTLANGEAAQTTTLRWEDYTQTAIDPTDDCTIWYVGDYLKAGATNYSTRIGAFRLPGCR